MAKYNQERIYEELDKLPIELLYSEYQAIKNFVQKKMEAEQQRMQDEASDLQTKIEKL